MRRAILGTAAAAAAAVVLLGGALHPDVSPAADARTLHREATRLQQQARVANDPTLYPRIEAKLRAAFAVEPQNAAALRSFAALQATRHRFDESLEIAERARRLEPHVASVYGLIGDANLELGRYREAFAAFERQVALRPSAAAYARISYARELLGDTRGAIAAMRLAVDAAAATSESAAWTRVQLGNLVLRTRLAAAERLYREALAVNPRYAPAYSALAKVAVARGRETDAARLYRRALELAPDPGAAAALGDLLAAEGDQVGAKRAHARAVELEALFARNGGRNQLEAALFDLDHGRDVGAALERAREGYRLRPSVEAAHVLARALYKNGRCAEARRYSLAALRLGTLDVGAMFDRARIERCLGNDAAAARFERRVRALDPYGLDLPPDA